MLYNNNQKRTIVMAKKLDQCPVYGYYHDYFHR